MTGEERQRLFERAKKLEASKRIGEALDCYVRAGAIEEAARILVRAGQHAQAADLLARNLGLPPGTKINRHTLKRLDGVGRKRALRAAICYQKAGKLERATTLLVGIGEVARAVHGLRQAGDTVGAARLEAEHRAHLRGTPDAGRDLDTKAAENFAAQGKVARAIEAFARAGKYEDAARLASRSERNDEAGRLFALAGMPYDAAQAFHRADDRQAALEHFMKVRAADPMFRAAAVEAIKLAHEQNRFDFTLENFVATFIDQPPRDRVEADAFYLMSDLYARHGHPESAADALAGIKSVFEDFKDVDAKLLEFRKGERGTSDQFARVLEEDLDFKRQGTSSRAEQMTSFGELPDLPDLPPITEGGTPVQGRPAAPAATRAGYDQFGRADSSPNRKGPSTGVNSSTRVGGGDRDQTMAQSAGTAIVSDAAAANLHDGPSSGATVAGEGVPQPDQTGPSSQHTLYDSTEVHDPNWKGFQVGSILSGRYRFEKVLGQGGMATVYKAFDMELDEHVAIKVFTSATHDEQMIARFKQELSLSRKLNHPNIIRLYDIGSFKGHRYITMEMLVGKDLYEYIDGPMDPQRAVHYCVQTLLGLQAAHDKNVVHRDMKPHNVFICDDGAVKVMDFGIAKQVSTPGMTVGNFVAGTPDYISPEQISGFSSVTFSTDIYAVGVMLFELLTGTVPFKGEEMLQIMMQHMNAPPPKPRDLNPNIPPALEAVCLKLLEKKPEDRYPNARAAAEAMQRAMGA